MQFHLRPASDIQTHRTVWINNEGKIAEAWEWAAICRNHPGNEKKVVNLD